MKLYVKTGCPWCAEAMQYLDKKGYKYNKIDVRTGQSAFEELKKISKQSKTPTMLLEKDDKELMLKDFGVEELVPFLEKNNITP